MDALERHLFTALPNADELSAGVVARGKQRCSRDGSSPWNVLRTVLLGLDAGDVRRGGHEHALDGDHRSVRAA